ncbi:MaoC family dehydratase [Tissierella sp. Yu-01]|uniref:MaoC family dehydratase n=1 Tax=Tissierella sp. Yu-01 TaxID=3035694 RepID=UPI00240DCC30|nr:MaoC family dehydratase [Tissierella sp. Yu-01]WFA10434.1 MaoC family dehydratase [Tissierella sp. Yu-01]
MKGKTIEDICIGDKASLARTISESDIYLYAGITGDTNPAHINEEESKKSIFKGRIAHGMLTAGLISAVLGTLLPGPGSIYLGQDLKFIAPVRMGDTITAQVEVIEIINNKIVKLRTDCVNQNGEVVIEGFATILPPKNRGDL